MQTLIITIEDKEVHREEAIGSLEARLFNAKPWAKLKANERPYEIKVIITDYLDRPREKIIIKT